MTGAERRKSLFWTVAGSYLAVLVLAVIIQAALLILVTRSLVDQWIKDGAITHVDQAVEEIEALPEDPWDRRIAMVVVRNSRPAAYHLFFKSADGVLLPSPEMDLRGRDRRRRFGGSERRRPGPRALPPDSLHQALPPIGLHPGPPRPFGRPGPHNLQLPAGYPDNMDILVSRDVNMDNGVQGTVLAAALEHPFDLPIGAPRRILLFLPIAILLAGVAGILMFRTLTRRLESLDAFALQVTEGRLDARIPNPGEDEIGRLAERLNRMAEALETSRDQMKENDRQRRQLFTDITHDLATPLTSIRGYAETLLNPDITKTETEREEYLADVLQEAKRIEVMVQELLELSRLESGSVRLESEKLDWAELCKNTIARFAKRYQSKGLGLEWDGSVEKAEIYGDGRRLEQIIENLLINALRYAKPGGRVRVGITSLHQPGAQIHRLSVNDDGPGFSEEDLPHIFDRFYRGDRSRSSAGSGLGLAIVSEIVRLHGGEIRAMNNSEGGASIVIEIPGQA